MGVLTIYELVPSKLHLLVPCALGPFSIVFGHFERLLLVLLKRLLWIAASPLILALIAEAMSCLVLVTHYFSQNKRTA